MDRASLRTVIVDVLQGIQLRLNDAARDLRDDDVIIGSIDHFDSLCGLEATVKLEERLDLSLPENVFVNESGTRALKLREVLDRILAATPTEDRNGNG